MSTEAKKWTQEELEAFLQEQQEQEWDDEWEASLPGEDEEEWADEEVLWMKRMEEERERLRRQNIDYYERHGFWLGREHQLLEELEAWLPEKKNEWYKIRDQQPKEKCEAIDSLNKKISSIEHAMFIIELRIEDDDDEEEYERKSYRLEHLKRKRYALQDIEDGREYRLEYCWLNDEWNRYLETKELMLRKTRSKDVTGTIMSFC